MEEEEIQEAEVVASPEFAEENVDSAEEKVDLTDDEIEKQAMAAAKQSLELVFNIMHSIVSNVPTEDVNLPKRGRYRYGDFFLGAFLSEMAYRISGNGVELDAPKHLFDGALLAVERHLENVKQQPADEASSATTGSAE
jgi:hypothetical protein